MDLLVPPAERKVDLPIREAPSRAIVIPSLTERSVSSLSDFLDAYRDGFLFLSFSFFFFFFICFFFLLYITCLFPSFVLLLFPLFLRGLSLPLFFYKKKLTRKKKGCKNRTVASTRLNPESSRSHAVLILKAIVRQVLLSLFPSSSSFYSFLPSSLPFFSSILLSLSSLSFFSVTF